MKDKVYLKKKKKKIHDIRNNCIYIFFLIECDDGTYGTNCSSNCGHCYQGQLCDKETGACPEGCGARYDGMYCNISKIER